MIVTTNTLEPRMKRKESEHSTTTTKQQIKRKTARQEEKNYKTMRKQLTK